MGVVILYICVNTGVGCDPYVHAGRPTTVYFTTIM